MVLSSLSYQLLPLLYLLGAEVGKKRKSADDIRYFPLIEVPFYRQASTHFVTARYCFIASERLHFAISSFH